MEYGTYTKLQKFFSEAPSIPEGIKDLIIRTCEKSSGGEIDDILSALRCVVDEIEEFFTTDPDTYDMPSTESE